MREQELVALQKALDIITGKAVQEKYSGNVAQKMPNSFLQIHSAGHQRVVAFLQQHGFGFVFGDAVIVSLPGVCGSFRPGHHNDP